MTTVGTATQMSFRDLAVAAAEMRRLHLDTTGSRRYSDRAVATLRQNHGVLLGAGGDPAVNAGVVELRSHATPLTYANRLHAVTFPRTAAWRAEERLVVDDRKLLQRSELTALRRRAEKDLARAKSRSRHPADGRLLHELAGNQPVLELVSRLSTEQILDVGSPRFPTLAKQQRRTRSALVSRDVRVLEALMMLLINAEHAVPNVFVISFSLAVGNIAFV